MLRRVQGFADHTNLAVHHPARADEVDTRRSLGAGHLGVHLEGAVVVDLPVGIEYAAVPVVGELVQAQVRHHRELIAHLSHHVGDGEVEDAVRVDRTGAGGVLGGRQAEQHHPAQAGLDRLGGDLLQGVPGVLEHPRHARDLPGLGGVLSHEQRQHELARTHRALGDKAAQRGRTTQSARPDRGVAHSASSCSGPATSSRSCDALTDDAQTAW